MSMLETQALTREFGGVIAVNKVDFVVEKNMITGLIGPNGAGKTTLFNNITGLDVPTSGKVFFEGKEITGTKADKVCRLGIARTFQNIRLFKELSVIDNVMVGRHFHTGQKQDSPGHNELSHGGEGREGYLCLSHEVAGILRS